MLLSRLPIVGVIVTVVAVGAASAAIPLTLAGSQPRDQHSELSPTPLPAPSVQHTQAPDASLYAAAIKDMVPRLVHGARWRVLYVVDHTCNNIPGGLISACEPRPIPPNVQRDLADALASYLPVRFIADAATVRDKNLTVINHGVTVTLGTPQITGAKARLPIAVQCSGTCGLGGTLLLARKAGHWIATGATGPGWIS